MSTSPVKGKSTASKQQPNLLDQIGKAWNDLMGGKKAAVPRAPVRTQSPQVRPTPTKAPPKTPPAPKKDTSLGSASSNNAARPPATNQVNTAPKPSVRSGDIKPVTARAPVQQKTAPANAPDQKPVVAPTTAQRPAVAPSTVKQAAAAPKEVYGPAAPSLASAEKRVSDYSKFYDKEATGKSNLQKSMDWSRKAFNEGYGDDMFKNNGKSAKALADVKAQLKSGKITEAQATSASSSILANFERERIRVTGAQANNAEIGKGVQGAGRVVTVAGAAIGGTIVAGPVGGIAAATVVGSAYDAATKLDQGSARFSHQFDVSNSVGGVTARMIKGEKVNNGDWARGVAGSGMDGISGAFAGGGMLSAKAAQTALLTAATQTGAKVTLTEMAKAAALSNLKTTLVQTAATTGYKTLTIMCDGSLSAKEQSKQVKDNVKQTAKQLLPNLAFGAVSSFAGVKVQLPNKVADGAVQYGMDVASNGLQKSLENVMAGKGAGLSTEDMASVATQSAGGTLNNVVQRVPHGQRGGGSDVPTAQPRMTQTSTLTGRTSTGQTVKLRPVGNSNRTSASIKPLPKNVRSAVAEARASKNPDASVQESKTSMEQIQAQIQKDMSHPQFQAHLEKSNSPAEVQRQNKAIDAMRAAGVPTASLIRPDQPLDVSKWNLPMGEVVLGKKPATDPALDMSKLNLPASQGASGTRPTSGAALDVSKWNLPMGEVVFGKQAVPGPVLPGLGVNFARKSGALVSQQAADPLTGQIIRIGPDGKLSVNNSLAPKNITAETPVRPEVEPPTVKALERAGFTRGGMNFALNFLDHKSTVDIWYQKPKTQTGKVESPSTEVKANYAKVIAEIMRDAVSNTANIRNSEDFGQFVAEKLNNKLPKSVGWAVKIVPPPSTLGAKDLGANLGSYIEIGNLQGAISSGAVLYDPNARIGRQYSLNTQLNAEGNTVMAKPLEITVGKRASISPFSIPYFPKVLGLGLNIGQSQEIKVPLAGEVNTSLLRSINRALNSPLSMQMWHDAGSDGYRQVRQVNFSLPNTLAREGSHRLPAGWSSIHDQLVPESKRDNDSKWASYTSGVLSWGSPALFGLSVRAGIRIERVEPVASQASGPSPIRHSSSLERQTPVPSLSTEPVSAEPFTFMSHKEGSPLIEVISSDVTNIRASGARILPEVKGTLLGGRQANVPMVGSVLNALNNYPVTSRDIGPIIQFVQSLKPLNATRREADAHVYQLVKDHPMGQPLSSEKQANLRAFIHWYTTYETPPRSGGFGSNRRLSQGGAD
jgi:hypothetical protein